MNFGEFFCLFFFWVLLTNKDQRIVRKNSAKGRTLFVSLVQSLVLFVVKENNHKVHKVHKENNNKSFIASQKKKQRSAKLINQIFTFFVNVKINITFASE